MAQSTEAPDRTRWHQLSVGAVLDMLGTHAANGLSDEEAARRLDAHGPNALPAPVGRSVVLRLLLQFHQPLIYILIASAVVTFALGEWIDSGVIAGVVLVNALVGFVQEGRAENALAALARSVASDATVQRDGRRLRLDARSLVPGDVVWLAAGDRVPADMRIIDARSMQTAEAALTGESSAVGKQSEALAPETPLADRVNMAFAGTMVVSGQASGVVVATGEMTETGHISRMIRETDLLATPLTRAMAKFSNLMLVVILALAVLTFAVGMLRGEHWLEMFMAAVALAVGAIPEGLPAAITVTLAIGVARMARRRAIIRRLPAVETLGSTTVICSDKTGTLTENQMTVRELYAGGLRFEVSGDGYAPLGTISPIDATGGAGGCSAVLRDLLVAGVLCNDASLAGSSEGGWRVTGDPTEAALLVVARKAGISETSLRASAPRFDEIPFDSERQFMATMHRLDGARVMFVKGAVERILSRCNRMLDETGQAVAFDARAVLAEAQALASRGLRVLAFARREGDAPVLAEGTLEAGLVFIGLQAMLDPPRREAIVAVAHCQRAGIRVKMITGDHAGTALAIARQIGIADPASEVLSGRELAALDNDALRRAASTVPVFARVEPEQKLRLVRALQAEGEVVAMTGDGVNDAPALKAADIGVAMGAGGTEVAKEAAAMVLTDDNFASIEAAVEEGRGIFDNLRKFIAWTLPTNFGEGLVILVAVLAGVTLPITPLQILWINMTTAVLLGLTLAFEPVEQDVMLRPPRAPAAPILDPVLILRIVLVGVLLLAGAFGLFMRWEALGASLAETRTIAANVFVAGEVFYLFNCRSLTSPFWRLGWFSNMWLWGGVLLTVLLQIGFTYLPVMNRLFGTAPLGVAEWLEILAAGFIVMLFVGAEKALRRRRVAPGG
ncbi:MAG: cation-transporting P-type ATPase [Rhodocyclaceae bacterium]|nr:cation-transporting P-type ATPase [Rhodocyclaceae bacterium]